MVVTAAAAATADSENGVACFVMPLPDKEEYDGSILRTSSNFPLIHNRKEQTNEELKQAVSYIL